MFIYNVSYRIYCESDFLGNRLYDRDLCARSLLGSGLRINPLREDGSRIGQRARSCNVFAEEASANPTSCSELGWPFEGVLN